MLLKTLTYEYRFTSYGVVIYLRDKNIHFKKKIMPNYELTKETSMAQSKLILL